MTRGPETPRNAERHLPGAARTANLLLAALLLVNIVILLLLGMGLGWIRWIVIGCDGLLLLGVIAVVPFAYLGVATLAFLALAASLQQADVLTCALNGLVCGLALYVRSRIAAGPPPPVRWP